MTDLEISKALALAIGWPGHRISVSRTEVRLTDAVRLDVWRIFDYRDWNVIGPVAEKFDCFPYRTALGVAGAASEWCAVKKSVRCYYADTPQKAIALAVIGAKK